MAHLPPNHATSISQTWDSQFQTIASLSRFLNLAIDPTDQSAMVSSDLDVIALLYLVISRCRDERLREEALTLLQKMWRREEMFDAAVVAEVSEAIMREVENGGRKFGDHCMGLCEDAGLEFAGFEGCVARPTGEQEIQTAPWDGLHEAVGPILSGDG